MKHDMSLMRIAAVLMFVSGFLIGLSVGTSYGAYADTPGYQGSRWRGTSVCVQNQVDNPMLRQAVYRAVQDLNATPTLHVINKGSSSCVGYAQVIYVVDANYASTWMALTAYPTGLTWGTTKSGLSTWFHNSGMVIKLNTRLLAAYPKSTTWNHVAIHELAHGVGLGHRSDTCNSVVSEVSLSSCGWSRPSLLTSVDKRTLATVYSW